MIKFRSQIKETNNIRNYIISYKYIRTLKNTHEYICVVELYYLVSGHDLVTTIGIFSPFTRFSKDVFFENGRNQHGNLKKF